ncbi:MAG: TatD family hydrolase [Anaerolineales bacterium]|nr:TatD family hydrolase [Anaerolineales bacterium]
MREANLTDTHCHLEFDQFEGDLGQVLKRAWQVGIVRLLTIGIDLESSQDTIEIAEKDDRIFAAVGIHPNSALNWNNQTKKQLEVLVEHPKVIALGEIGLDYYRDEVPIEIQKEVFRIQLEIAYKHKIPVVIHTRNKSERDRKCIEDVLHIIGEFNNKFNNQKKQSIRKNRRGVLHSFSGNIQEANTAIEMGFYVGISGPVTFKNAQNLRDVVSMLPLNRILIETDSPFLAPHPYRGKRNEPAYVIKVAKKIAEVYNLPVDNIYRETTRNANLLFHWSKIS